MSVFDSSDFKALKAKWYQKLKKSGFKDIEHESENFIDKQTVYDFSSRTNFRSGTYESVRDYYYWATDRAARGRFKSKKDKKIWRLHANGLSSHEVAKIINVNQAHVWRKINSIREYLHMNQSSEEKRGAA